MEKKNTHFTKEKKQYVKPVLKKIGNVNDLTLDIKGSTQVDGAELMTGPNGG